MHSVILWGFFKTRDRLSVSCSHINQVFVTDSVMGHYRGQKYTGITLMDLEKAYDKVSKRRNVEVGNVEECA